MFQSLISGKINLKNPKAHAIKVVAQLCMVMEFGVQLSETPSYIMALKLENSRRRMGGDGVAGTIDRLVVAMQSQLELGATK